jgi:hypothetical protein
MNDETTDDFDWGELGEQWWRDTGAQCGATNLQIRFACARYAGASATGAARLAGYTDSEQDKSAIRQSGYKALRTTAVANMLALAAAEDKAPPDRILDKTERAKKLSELAHSPDPTLSIRAIEALNKMADREAELGQGRDQDGMSDWRAARELLQLEGGGLALLSIWVGLGQCPSWLPLLHDVHRAVMREAPDMWERYVNRFSPEERTRLQTHLDNPDWQREARTQIWGEVGVEIATPNNTETGDRA